MALHKLLKDKNHSVDHLLTTVNAHHNRVSMHGVRRELLQQQLSAIGIHHSTVELPELASDKEYEALMLQTVNRLKDAGFTHAAFGDIFLEDLRKYREQQLQPHHITAVFPLWKQDTRALMEAFIEQGFKAIVVCVNASLLPETFAGRMLDRDFINDLPAGIDPCGENGEFHTFCFDGPVFKQPVPFSKGETVYKEYPHNDQVSGFWFTDLLPL